MRLLLAAAVLAAAPAIAAESALDTAQRLLRHLAEGNIAEAAALSNAPRRRFELLRAYRDAVGEEEFKRVYARYLEAEDRLVAEAVIGRHRLLVWDLGEEPGNTGSRFAGQYYVEIEGRFVLDDVPSRERNELRKVLQSYRSGNGATRSE